MESKDAEAQGRAHGNKSLGDSTSCDIKNNSLETRYLLVLFIIATSSVYALTLVFRFLPLFVLSLFKREYYK